MLIKHSSVVEFLARPLQDYTWVKSLRRDQILNELRTLRARPYFKTEPWLHQLACFYIAMSRPDFLFLLDMGLGKTKLLLDLITQCFLEDRLSHALVTVPRKINVSSWRDDIELHSDLTPQLVTATEIEEKWDMLAYPDETHLTVIDMQSLHLALSMKEKAKRGKRLVPDEMKVAHVQGLYNFISMDEIHLLSNDQSLWFKLLRRMTAFCNYTYGLTGTLFGKDPAMIWPQFFLIDRGETFGENKGMFRASFFAAEKNKWGRGEKFEYKKSSDRKLNQMLRHRSLRYDEAEVLDLPERLSRYRRFDMGVEQRKHYLLALEGLIQAGNSLQQLEGAWIKMRRIISGYLTWKDQYGDHTLHFDDNPKLEGLEALIEEVGGRSKIMIPYVYTETGRTICERVAQMGLGYEWIYGGTKDQAQSRDRFLNDPKCTVLVANDQTISTGNDGLQKVARYMFVYETPTPVITRKQLIKRLHRSGVGGRVFIYDLVMRRSLDGGILADLQAGVDTYDSVVNGRRKLSRGFLLSDNLPA